MPVECSRFLLSIWPNRAKRIGLLLASWTPLVLWLLFLDWVKAVGIRACADNRALKFRPSWLEPFAFSPPRCSHFFSFSNCFTSGNKVDYHLTASQVVQGTLHTGEDVWCLCKMSLFVFPRQIAQDLVRFLRCIAADELDSPPRTPTYVKPHLPPPLGSAASMDSDDIPYVVNPHPRSSSVSKPPSRGPLTRGNSLEKGYLTRTASIERSSRKSVTSSSPTSTTPPK